MAEPFVEHSFACMVERVSDYAIFLLDPDGIIRTWNPAAECMKGYTKSEAIGRHLSMLYTDEDRHRGHPAHNLKRAEENGTFQEQTWRRRKDGSLMWAMVEIIAVRDDTGALTGFCKITRDISELRQVQENLVIEKERALVTLSAIGDGVIAVDHAGRVEYLNWQAQHFTGWSQEEAKGRAVQQVFDIVSANDYSAEEASLADVPFNGMPPRTTRVLRVRDGGRHLVETLQSDIPGSEGGADGTVIVFHDVIERQRMGVALRDADRRKDEFLAMLAHELRNPLAPVSAAAELLALGKLDAGASRKASQVIIRQVRHMTALVDDLLDVSRVSRGQVTLNMTALDMKLVVGLAIEQVRPLIEGRQHTLMTRLSPAVAHVKGDEKRLVQVVSNLLNNAAKYTPPGGLISIDMSATPSTVCVEVSDNGIGIEPAIQAMVFDMFEQVQRNADRSSGGLGIGLALVRSLAQLHGGSVTCHSGGLGQGSRFTLCIPQLDVDAPGPERRRVERPVELPVAEPHLRVLVVDDNVDAADMLQFFLATTGHQVEIAHTAQQALDAVATFHPDVCILDIGLPDRSGNALAADIRKLATPAPVLFALTGYGTARDRNVAAEVGFDHYFVKPADLDALTEALSKVDRRLGDGQDAAT